MKTLIAATFYVILAGGQSETKQIRIDPKACNIGEYVAQVPVNGEWQTAKVGIKCSN